MIAIDKLESILVCPITGNKLSWMTQEQLHQLNERIAQGTITLSHQATAASTIPAGFKVHEQEIYYPVIDDIIYLLSDLALQGNQGVYQETATTLLTKRQVQTFYDNVGWQKNADIYQDAQDSEDLRQVSQQYIWQCHQRLNNFLPKSGQFLLDIASGPIQYSAYLSYSEHFEYRICADISKRALLEAKQKLGDKGIYLLCDITQLPLQNNVIDSVVSLHTLYHVPQNEQSKAFAELHRVLKSGGVSLIVYSWGRRSLLMNICLFPYKVFSYLKRKVNTQQPGPALYFYAHSYQWFCHEIKQKYATRLFSWRSVNVPFLKIFIHQNWGGKQLLKSIFWLENRFHGFMGRFGAYPLFVSVKK